MWKFPGYEIDQPIDWDWMCHTYSWLADMKGVEQDPEWHAEGDVWTHTQMVVEALIGLEEFQELDDQSKHMLVAAALLHDVEKRSTTQIEVLDGRERITSPGHAKKGEFTTRTLLYTEIPTPLDIREQIAKLVRFHGLPLWAIEKPDVYKRQDLYFCYCCNGERYDVHVKIVSDQNTDMIYVNATKKNEPCAPDGCS